MSWAAARYTTRVEDIAYCLIGLFDINMPLLYGEGPKAFIRLQLEILNRWDDDSLFAWKHWLGEVDHKCSGLLATHPFFFHNCGDIERFNYDTDRPPYLITNKGLRVEVPLVPVKFTEDLFLLTLNCAQKGRQTPLAIYLKSHQSQYVRTCLGLADSYKDLNHERKFQPVIKRTLAYLKLQHDQPAFRQAGYREVVVETAGST